MGSCRGDAALHDPPSRNPWAGRPRRAEQGVQGGLCTGGGLWGQNLEGRESAGMRPAPVLGGSLAPGGLGARRPVGEAGWTCERAAKFSSEGDPWALVSPVTHGSAVLTSVRRGAAVSEARPPRAWPCGQRCGLQRGTPLSGARSAGTEREEVRTLEVVILTFVALPFTQLDDLRYFSDKAGRCLLFQIYLTFCPRFSRLKPESSAYKVNFFFFSS